MDIIYEKANTFYYTRGSDFNSSRGNNCNSIIKRIPDNDSGVIGNTAGNLNSGGLFCETDGTVFFSNPYDDGHLYSMDSDCDNIKYLSHDRVSYINAAGKFVYYVKGNAESDDMTMMFRGDLFESYDAVMTEATQKFLLPVTQLTLPSRAAVLYTTQVTVPSPPLHPLTSAVKI